MQDIHRRASSAIASMQSTTTHIFPASTITLVLLLALFKVFLGLKLIDTHFKVKDDKLSTKVARTMSTKRSGSTDKHVDLSEYSLHHRKSSQRSEDSWELDKRSPNYFMNELPIISEDSVSHQPMTGECVINVQPEVVTTKPWEYYDHAYVYKGYEVIDVYGYSQNGLLDVKTIAPSPTTATTNPCSSSLSSKANPLSPYDHIRNQSLTSNSTLIQFKPLILENSDATDGSLLNLQNDLDQVMQIPPKAALPDLPSTFIVDTEITPPPSAQLYHDHSRKKSEHSVFSPYSQDSGMIPGMSIQQESMKESIGKLQNAKPKKIRKDGTLKLFIPQRKTSMNH